ncbi:hypothetical protein CROQUDRAFT_95342 [Cronartium quercuum f. sp. fusiforme G11]|uniref:Uncharacterized protein n=1 Tax=Cronartium quercuum f. sp. fusiforme G11 TaxID=708437 RepID=A0A9P6NHI6_9BASI|nr:hypothetical protein CROQUDRAFT_95342 [Cronartium quercuum f. sp. fusiforme G11]
MQAAICIKQDQGHLLNGAPFFAVVSRFVRRILVGYWYRIVRAKRRRAQHHARSRITSTAELRVSQFLTVFVKSFLVRSVYGSEVYALLFDNGFNLTGSLVYKQMHEVIIKQLSKKVDSDKEKQDAQVFFVKVVDVIRVETKRLAKNLLVELVCPSFSNSIVDNRD